MSNDLHPAFFKTFFTEDLYLIGEKQGATQQEEVTKVPVASEAPAAPQPAAAPKAAPKQPVVVVLKYPFQELEASQRELLTKITAAVKMDIHAAKIITEPAYNSDPEQIKSFRNVLSFGVELSPATTKYMVIKKNDQQFLASDSLAALEQAIALKGKLWKAMQEMFPTA